MEWGTFKADVGYTLNSGFFGSVTGVTAGGTRYMVVKDRQALTAGAVRTGSGIALGLPVNFEIYNGLGLNFGPKPSISPTAALIIKVPQGVAGLNDANLIVGFGSATEVLLNFLRDTPGSILDPNALPESRNSIFFSGSIKY